MTPRRPPSELVRTLTDSEGTVLSTFDFGALGLHQVVAEALMRAHEAEFGHTSLESQRQSWRCIRKLAVHLRDAGAAEDAPLPVAIAADFREWLASSGLGASTAQSVLNVVLIVLRWCRRNADGVVDKLSKLVVPGFVREGSAAREPVSEREVKKILSACYLDIESVETRLSLGRRLLSSGGTTTSEKNLARLLGELLDIGGGLLPTQRVVGRSKKALARRVAEAGGLRELTRLLWMTPEAMFPFYLAIMVQTSGNPMAVVSLNRNCIRAHPLREDLEFLVWEKPRANREQRAEFPMGRTWGAPNIVRRLVALNQDLAPLAGLSHREKLFIVMKPDRKVATPCFQLFHLLLRDFINRHELSDFDFKDLRRAGARLHHQAAGSINAARARLNHRSSRTTERYTQLSDLRDRHDAVIRRFQGQIVSRGITQASGGADRPAQTAEPVGEARPAPTVFGFTCKDPLGGIELSTPRGVLCLQFQKCATCPGAIIPLDDPNVVARLLHAHQELADARERSEREGWWERFAAHYEATLIVLEKELLPAVSSGVRKKALALGLLPQVPRLE